MYLYKFNSLPVEGTSRLAISVCLFFARRSREKFDRSFLLDRKKSYSHFACRKPKLCTLDEEFD